MPSELGVFPGLRVLEPLLDPVTLTHHVQDLDWVIVGSETGKGHPRSMELDWARRVRDEALEAGVPLFVK